MPGYKCKCGQWISYGDIPSRNEWLFISDEGFDGFSGTVNAEDVYRAMRSFLRCPSCARLWLFWNGFASEPEEYLPAEPSKQTAEPDAATSVSSPAGGDSSSGAG